jgi:D-sedoheptulose 7-phosphate isomerase
MKEIIKQHILEHEIVLNSIESLIEPIQEVADLMSKCLSNGGSILWCGNGGSASDCQHLAGELVGRFVGDRRPLRSISLNSDTSVMTCIINDYGYEHIFSRQVEALGSSGDILVGISTSGNSQNILNAFKKANKIGMHTIGFLGKGGGKASALVSNSIIVPSDTTARVQEIHILIGHIICDLIEEKLCLK